MVQIALMMLAAAVPLMAQAFDPDLRLRLQEAVVAARETHNIVGVSAAVLLDGELATFCAGMSHEGVPIDDQMVFGIGSNTKTLTAAAMMRLQDRGVLSIDDAIGTYLPPLAHVDPEITIRQLLNHTSGLGDYATGPTYADSIRKDPRRVWKRDELVTMIPPSQAAPGAAFDYCNTNYLLVGMIIERVTGQPLQDVLSIQPMQLFPDTPITGALAHRWMGGQMGRQDFSATPMQSEWSGAWAAGAVIARAQDLAQWYDGLFSGQHMTAAALTEMTTVTNSSGYGLGISRLRLGDVPTIGHGGQIRGYSSIAVRVPSLQASVVVLTNCLPCNAQAVADTIIQVLRADVTSVAWGEHDQRLLVSQVWTMDGRLLMTTPTDEELRSLPMGVYVLQSQNDVRCVAVMSDGTLAVGTRSSGSPSGSSSTP
ncbi:MAG: serine hydrolase domain-containing protein [Candidatus Kapaibacteriota bacterium]